MTTTPTLLLNDGTRFPAIGLGTYSLEGDRGAAAIGHALDLGYRLLDTALGYGNEDAVGAAIAHSDIPRDEIIITTKLHGNDHGYESTLRSFERSRTNLGVDYVDSYLIHWPQPELNKYVDSWRAMIKLRADGLVRSIGVSNFDGQQLARLAHETGVVPAINQIELHPRLIQSELRALHTEFGILTESYSPLKHGAELRSEQAIERIARAHGATPSQVVLRWHIQLGSVPIPRSVDPGHQSENFNVFRFALTPTEMGKISSLNIQ